MSAGKLSAQAGHAFLNAYLQTNNDITSEYQKDGIGTKICLKAKNLNSLLKIEGKLKVANIPYSLIVDSGHVMPPFFDGSPIVTAIGIGPVYPSKIKNIIKRLKLV